MKMKFSIFLLFAFLRANADSPPFPLPQAPLCFSRDESSLLINAGKSQLTPKSLAYAIANNRIKLRFKEEIPLVKSVMNNGNDYMVYIQNSGSGGYSLSRSGRYFEKDNDPCIIKVDGLVHPKEVLGTSTLWNLKDGKIYGAPNDTEPYVGVTLDFEMIKNGINYHLQMVCSKILNNDSMPLNFYLKSNQLPFELIGADSPYNTVEQMERDPLRRQPLQFAEKQ